MSINSIPIWYFINDISIIILNLIGICTAIVFIYIIIRAYHPTYSVSILIACKTCLAIGLMSCSILFNNIYALRSDVRGESYEKSFCTLRGTIFSILYIKMYTSLCLKAFNRLRCIVYRIRPKTNSYRTLCLLILIQWCVIAILVTPILFTDGIKYGSGSYLCLVTTQRPWQFIFLMIIYYVSICFISSVYLYILYYVMHLSLLEKYRHKRRLALLRRIIMLLIMLILPGIVYTILIIYWCVFQSIPDYSFKIITLFESIGHTGVLLTIFISNSYVRKQFSRKRKFLNKKQPVQCHQKNDHHILPLKRTQRRPTTSPSILVVEPIVLN